MVELFTCMGRIEFNELFVHCAPRGREGKKEQGSNEGHA